MFAYLFVNVFSNSQVCNYCQETFGTLRRKLELGIPKKFLITEFVKQCSDLHLVDKAPCTKVIYNIESIFDDLNKRTHISKVCQKHKFCLEPPTRQIKHVSNYVYEPIVENNVAKCEVCTKFLGWAEYTLNIYTFHRFHKLIHKICPDHKFYRDLCTRITDAQIHSILNGFKKNLPAETICRSLKFARKKTFNLFFIFLNK